MGSHTGTERKVDDLWSQIIAEDGDDQRHNNQQKQQQIAVTYQRRRPDKPAENKSSVLNNDSRLSFAGDTKRISWNRSLSTSWVLVVVGELLEWVGVERWWFCGSVGGDRVATIVVVCCRAAVLAVMTARAGKKVALLPNFEKERAYFQEVDAFELEEESPSPMKFAWIAGNQIDGVVIPSLCTRLEKWLHAKKRNYIPSSALSSILKTPAVPLEPIPYDGLESVQRGIISEEACLQNLDFQIIPEETNIDVLSTGGGEFDDIVSEIKKLSLSSHSSSLDGDLRDPFSVLLQECRQSAPLTLLDVFCKLCEPSSIVKIGEGTYGEAFIAGDNVCKIVPIDGDLRVNGEVQKRSVELLEEVILTQTLNHLRGREAKNATTTFIESKDLKVCQGPYDPALLKAWEAWDLKHGSENDHPKQFPEKQCYVVFVLEHGGTDLESFVLLDFNEARSLLAQVNRKSHLTFQP
ncbi:hypothetical protein Nepgr_014960 [Nepenthes gracilis]|uniref:Uncharacterized protein n=1 Tax=Nepenthes gracilis TaxID=150966 RepID=A0AAD3SLS4_NEPGR|nr:hypothetical protein Nepgr_014960 [Nepenthes gracilis]